jgi:hypothetical protein
VTEYEARVAKLARLTEIATAIVDDAQTPWKVRFEAVFDDGIAQEVSDLGFVIEYYDPDTSDEEDVLAYVNALVAKSTCLQRAVKS